MHAARQRAPAPATEELRVAIRALLEERGEARLRVFGWSMLPAVWPGTEVRIVRCGHDDISRGDLILYERNGRLVLHRALERTPTGWVTRGDNRPEADGPVDHRALLGRVPGLCVMIHYLDGVPEPGARVLRRVWTGALPATRSVLGMCRVGARALRHVRHRTATGSRGGSRRSPGPI